MSIRHPSPAWQAVGVRGPVRRGAALLLWLVAGVLLAGCTGNESGGAADGPTPAQLLAQAKRTLDQAQSVRFSLGTDDLPDGIPGLLRAAGVGTHDPAFQGDISVSQSGLTVDAEVVAVDGEVYAKIGFVPVFATIDPAAYGAPDPARLMDARAGISSLLTAATGVTEEGKVRDGAQVLTSISGRIPGPEVAAIFPSADDASAFDAVFALSSDAALREVVISGPFYQGSPPVTYTLRLESYGGRVEISPP